MQLQNSRRGFLAGSIAIAAATAIPAAAQPILETPRGPMLLKRKLVRDLHDGVQVVVTRVWQVEFSKPRAGIEINGKQISAVVDAPEKLRAIAKIEEQRPTGGMFPILLTQTGLIDHVGEINDHASIAAAVRKAEEMIAQLPRNEDEKAHMRQAIADLQVAGSSIFEIMPPDLFFPNSGKVEKHRQLTLPDGSIGEFRLSYSSRPASRGPWLKQAERHIETQIGRNIRRSYEVWSLQFP